MSLKKKKAILNIFFNYYFILLFLIFILLFFIFSTYYAPLCSGCALVNQWQSPEPGVFTTEGYGGNMDDRSVDYQSPSIRGYSDKYGSYYQQWRGVYGEYSYYKDNKLMSKTTTTRYKCKDSECQAIEIIFSLPYVSSDMTGYTSNVKIVAAYQVGPVYISQGMRQYTSVSETPEELFDKYFKEPEPVTEPIQEPVIEPEPEPIQEPVTEPIQEPVIEPTEDLKESILMRFIGWLKSLFSFLD